MKLAPISLEGRANLIADTVNRIEHVGEPAKRKEAVRAEALKHLREVAQIYGLAQ